MATFGARDIVNYDAKNKVLICRQCKYAIQKSALGSHLLRHKIYRGERQRLLSLIARLDIPEPDNVQLPAAGSSPVDGLPIISGYRCTATSCENLCASSKRMRRHWSDTHGVSDPPHSFARSVQLQTFFRGTKLRYFEVVSPGATPVTSQDARLEQHNQVNPVATPAPSSLAPVPPPCLDLDLEMLRYFHHFNTTTSLTLPAKDHGSAQHWQIDVVEHALKLRWLMCGLLAISANHLAALSNDEGTKQVHLEHSARFLQGFATGWEAVRHDSNVAGGDEVRAAAAQLLCIHRCCHWTSESPEEMISEPTPFNPRLFTRTVQGCFDPSFALRCAIGSDDLPEEEILPDQAGHRGSSEAVVVPSAAAGAAPPALMDRLRTLPHRMREAVGRPDSALDFFATLSAIDVLVECCPISYASDDVGAVWMGMVSWLSRVSDHFSQMVWRRSPAALVVLAHWSLLVERAERHCWFLKGSAAKLRRQIARELSKDGTVQSPVEDLILDLDAPP